MQLHVQKGDSRTDQIYVIIWVKNTPNLQIEGYLRTQLVCDSVYHAAGLASSLMQHYLYS